jgi:hypothetical protein
LTNSKKASKDTLKHFIPLLFTTPKSTFSNFILLSNEICFPFFIF